MQSVALAVTSEIRKKGTGLNIRVNGEELCAKGTVLQTTVCTKFDWQWLFFFRSL
jgi:hypothetical protein